MGLIVLHHQPILEVLNVSKNSILPIIFKRHQKSSNYQQQAKNTVFSGKTAKKEQIRTKYGANTGKKSLEKSNNPAYLIYTVAKNSGQDWNPALTKIRSRIFHGFFYACDKLRCVMTDWIEEPSGSPFPLVNGSSNSVQSVTFRLEPKVTVSQLTKETAHV